MMKKSPGPLAPPERSLPRRNITALSYSWTTFVSKYLRGKGNKFNFTLTHIQSDTGIVTRKSRNENVVMICAHKPARSSAFPRISENITIHNKDMSHSQNLI